MTTLGHYPDITLQNARRKARHQAGSDYRHIWPIFVFTLPDGWRVTCHIPAPARGENNRMKKRILIVEDDSKLVQILRDNFAFEGYEVASTTDGREALALAQDSSPDVILLDAMLPGANGFQICESLRRRSQTPILMVTARTLKTDKLKGLNAGADDYITKPFDIDEVLARVRAWHLRRTRPHSGRCSRQEPSRSIWWPIRPNAVNRT